VIAISSSSFDWKACLLEFLISLLNTVSIVKQTMVNLGRVCMQGKRRHSKVIKAIVYMELKTTLIVRHCFDCK